jgi:kinetochore protein Spc7/SPC105
MAYKRELELVFDMASFQAPAGQDQDQDQDQSTTTPIDVWYIGVAKDGTPRALSPEREFFLQVIRDHVRCLSQSRTPVHRMLHTVRAAWDISTTVVDNIALVNVTFPTKVIRTSDSSIEVRSSFLLPQMTTKVDVGLHIKGAVSADGIDVAVTPQARVIYGESFDADKIAEFLSARISTPSEASEGKETGLWSDTFVALHDKLMARARK